MGITYGDLTSVPMDLERRFMAIVESCIPDIAFVEDGSTEASPSDYEDEIRDHAGDKAGDMFPNVPAADREAMVDRTVKYFCG